MSTIVNFVTSNFIFSTSYGAVTDGISVMIFGLLFIFLIEKVLIDAYEGKPDENNTLAFTLVILPFLIVVAVVIVLRMAQILHL